MPSIPLLIFIEELTMFLDGLDYRAIAFKKETSSSTARNRVVNSLHNLVTYFKFDQKNIPYPHTGKYSGRFNNAPEHKEFWLKVVNDYNNSSLAVVPHNKNNTYDLIAVAKKIKRNEVGFNEDGFYVSSDCMPFCAYTLKIGKKYKITIEEVF